MGANAKAILLVEHDDLSRLALARSLVRIGLTVTDARDGMEALTVSATGPPFDVAVLDTELPDTDGVWLGRRLLQLGRVRELMFYTATSDLLTLARARAHGVLVHKREGPDTLVAELISLLPPSPPSPSSEEP